MRLCTEGQLSNCKAGLHMNFLLTWCLYTYSQHKTVSAKVVSTCVLSWIALFRFNTNFEKTPPLAHENPLLKDNWTVLLDSLIGQPYWTVLLNNLIGQPSYVLTYSTYDSLLSDAISHLTIFPIVCIEISGRQKLQRIFL